jgi:zinc protease
LKRSVVAALVLLLCSVPAWADEEPMKRVFPYETHRHTLENGLAVILVPMPSDGLVAYWSIVRTGSRDEYEAGRTGFAHFFEHMMFQGTEAYPQEEYNAVVTKMGADANAYTTDDLTAYHMGITVEDLEQTIKIESDRFQNLGYSEQDFRTEAGAVYGEYRKNRTNPFFALYEAMCKEAYGKHTYGHTTMGYEKDIKAMPEMFEYSQSFFARYYRPENVVLFIAGDIEPQATLKMIETHYGAWSPGYVQPKVQAEPEQKAERHVEVKYDGQSLPILWVAYKADRFDPAGKQGVALSLLADLAFGETSPIHKKLVLEEQLVEFISADAGMNRDPGLMDIYTRVKDPAKINYVLAEIDKVVERYRQNPPEAQRLADLKSRLRYSFLMNLDTPDRVASSLARIVAITGGIEAVDELYETYSTITPEDVQGAAKHYLVPARRTVGTLKGAR